MDIIRFEENPPPVLDLNEDPANLAPDDDMESDVLVKNFYDGIGPSGSTQMVQI